jgi:chorismate mutase/prephenate dehydratase
MSLKELRTKIDALDAQVVKLLAERFRLAQEIGRLKKDTGQPVTNTTRETRVMQHIAQLAEQEGLDPLVLQKIYHEVIASAKTMQTAIVAFQGEFGAYSQEAALSFFGSATDTRPYENLDGVFEAVEKGQAAFGVVPVENSLEGSISRTYDLMLDSSLKVCGEIELRVSHCLIANPGATIDSIRQVYSHPQALGQCQAFLRHLKCEIIPTYDTAGSVKMIRDKRILDGAAIASARAAEIYQMLVLARGIEDNAYNFTRFFILGKHDCLPTGKDKTSLVFSVRHKPGALFDFLSELAKNKVNLTKIESRPTRQKPWEYNFYLDFEGHHDDTNVKTVLAKLEDYATFIKVLGSYPKAISIMENEQT